MQTLNLPFSQNTFRSSTRRRRLKLSKQQVQPFTACLSRRCILRRSHWHLLCFDCLLTNFISAIAWGGAGKSSSKSLECFTVSLPLLTACIACFFLRGTRKYMTDVVRVQDFIRILSPQLTHVTGRCPSLKTPYVIIWQLSEVSGMWNERYNCGDEIFCFSAQSGRSSVREITVCCQVIEPHSLLVLPPLLPSLFYLADFDFFLAREIFLQKQQSLFSSSLRSYAIFLLIIPIIYTNVLQVYSYILIHVVLQSQINFMTMMPKLKCGTNLYIAQQKRYRHCCRAPWHCYEVHLVERMTVEL